MALRIKDRREITDDDVKKNSLDSRNCLCWFLKCMKSCEVSQNTGVEIF